MLTYHDLAKKGKEKSIQFPEVKVALLGNCATQHLAKALRGFGVENNLNTESTNLTYI